MIKNHPVFKKPENEDTKIWRYMSFAKYASLLNKSALFFARVDKLEDKFEAKYPKNIFDPNFEAGLTPEQRATLEENKQTIRSYSDNLRLWTVVNCWQINDYESDAMWKSYTNVREGVAIQSTYRRLIESFQGYTENDVFMGQVGYIDHDKDLIPWENVFEILVHKNVCFQHERELRVIIMKDTNKEMQKANLKCPAPTTFLEFPPEGIYAKIILQNLIEKVVISPKAGKWFDELVQSITLKYGVSATVTKSLLA